MRIAEVLLLGLLCSACSDPVMPLHDDLEAARDAWIELSPAEYTFEVATVASSSSPGEPIRVHVRDGAVVTARTASGQDVPDYSLTIDGLWARIVEARDEGELNSARFTRNGIPAEVNMGEWARDAGIHYSIRRFELIGN